MKEKKNEPFPVISKNLLSPFMTCTKNLYKKTLNPVAK